MSREEIIQSIKRKVKFDIVIVGGGASGLGVALDAVSRGLSVCLIEKSDYGSGTSSKSTKLLHGGVRYLAQGDVALVTEALAERSFVLEKAPHLSNIQEFIIPYYKSWEGYYYLAGLKVYDLMAFKRSLGSTKMISKEETIKKLPNIKKDGLKGGIVYFDGQFDDARLCIDLVKTIEDKGGLCINYVKCTGFTIDDQKMVNGITVFDLEKNEEFNISGDHIVNACGVWSAELLQLSGESDLEIIPARGSHIVVDKRFLKGEAAIMIPKTTDGRVLFIIPWKGKAIIGTTDIQAEKIESNPKITEEEIDFILTNAKAYLESTPTKSDIKSTYAGLRPLVTSKSNTSASKQISRNHKIVSSSNGLYSLLGGKWTTFRRMGQDTVNYIAKHSGRVLNPSSSESISILPPKIASGEKIHNLLDYTWDQIDNICKYEHVERLEDLLSRRTRCIFLDKQATLEVMDRALIVLRKYKNASDEWMNNERNAFYEFAKSF
jgi:glycerol-3-phosphate dehydrogenase